MCDGKEPRYVNYGKTWTTEEWQSVTQGIHNTLKSFVCKDMGKEEVCRTYNIISNSFYKLCKLI
jgi:hypothetical protein